MPGGTMKLSLIVSTYNQPAVLEKVLLGISLMRDMPEEILIADDGSGPETRAMIDGWREKLRVPLHHHWHPDNGFLKTTILNKSVAAAEGDYLVFLDGDCVPHPKFIADHRKLAQRGYWVQGRRSFVKEKHVPAFVPGKTSVWAWAFMGRMARPHKIFRAPLPAIFWDHGQRGILGCNMAFWRDDVIAVTGFDEAYEGRGMGADSDLASRVYNLGRGRKFVYWHALVYHLDHPIAPRPHYDANRKRLDEVLRSGKTRCEQGVDQYLLQPQA
jgi:glycosyltransferase involved in cell wall biosynthesis